MQISDDLATILFKSKVPWYALERSGLKTNTVRRMDEVEAFDSLVNALYSLHFIEIWNGEEHFTRLLTNVSYYDGVFIFSWKHGDV